MSVLVLSVLVVLHHMQRYFIYVTAHRCAGGLSDSQHHRHFVGFLNVQVQALTPSLRLFRETTPFQSPFTTRTGIRMTYSRLKPTGSPLKKVEYEHKHGHHTCVFHLDNKKLLLIQLDMYL